MEKKRSREELLRETSLTYADYAELTEEGERCELVDGRLEFLATPTNVHQMISSMLPAIMLQSCGNEFVVYGPIDLILSEREVRQPDLIILHRSRTHVLTKRGCEGPPDAAVEILSPSSVRRDRVHKTNVYARFGIPEYWVIDPLNCVLEQYVLAGNAYSPPTLYTEDDPVRSERMPCVSFTMNALMGMLPPDIP